MASSSKRAGCTALPGAQMSRTSGWQTHPRTRSRADRSTLVVKAQALTTQDKALAAIPYVLPLFDGIKYGTDVGRGQQRRRCGSAAAMISEAEPRLSVSCVSLVLAAITSKKPTSWQYMLLLFVVWTAELRA